MAAPCGPSGRSGPLLLPGPAEQAGQPVRASQAERDEAVSELRDRFVAGQLSHDTFVQRVEIALAARDRGELAGLFTDLRGSRWSLLGLARRERHGGPAGTGGWRALAARMAIGSRASAVVAPVRQAVASSARLLSQPRRPHLPRGWTPPTPADLLFPVGSQPRFTIGRNPESDLVIPDITVSWQHAGLDRSGPGWLLIDFGSTNGTRLNGWRVREPVPVSPGDQVSFGAVTFVLRPAPDPA